MWSDGAQCDPFGKLVVIAPSYLDSPDQKWIIGAPLIGRLAIAFHAQLTARMWTLDQINDDDGQLFETQLIQHGPDEGGDPFWLVGWSERDQRCGILQFDPQGLPGTRAQAVRAAVSHELDDDNRAALETLVARAISPRQVDMNAFGLTILEAQRRIPVSYQTGGQSYFRVGGYAVQSEIGRDGIRHEIIHHWPDKVGEMIDPFGLSRRAVS